MNKVRWSMGFVRKSAVLIMVILLLVGCGIMPEEEETLAPPLIQPEVITYKTVTPTTGYIDNSITCTGSFMSVNVNDIFFSNASGRLKSIYVKPGDTVTKGTVLADLLAQEIENELEIQEILLDTKQKDYDYTKKVTDMAIEKAIKEQSTSLEETKLNATFQLNMKENDLKIATLKVNQLKEELSKSTLVSPIDGTVTYVASIEEGQYFEAYKTIIRVADMKSLQLEYQGDKALSFAMGAEVNVKIDEKDYIGNVVFIPSSAPVEDRQLLSQTIRIEVKDLPVEVDNADRAEITLVLDAEEDALIIPRSALKTYLGKDIVYVLENDLRVQKYIELGIESTSMVQVLSGISEQDKIIIE